MEEYRSDKQEEERAEYFKKIEESQWVYEQCGQQGFSGNEDKIKEGGTISKYNEKGEGYLIM
jgi:hypothetical protein